MDTESRNDIVMNYHKMVWYMINKNRRLLKALRLDFEEVYQELMITVIEAVNGFDAMRSSSIKTHISKKLQYAILDLKKRFRPCGVTGAKDVDLLFHSLDYQYDSGFTLELPVEPEYGTAEISDAMALLTPEECEAVKTIAAGVTLCKKAELALIDSAKAKFCEFYGLEAAHA